MERLSTVETLGAVETYKERDDCRICNTKLEVIQEFGELALPAWEKEENPIHVPMTLCMCPECTTVQLKQTTNPELLWNENYGYRSGVNETMVSHLKGISEEAQQTVPLKSGDIVIDIGCNDGTLLKNYPNNVMKVGFEPSSNTLPYMHDNMVGKGPWKTYVDFFGKDNYNHDFNSRAKVVTAISMFYDLENPNEFVEDVDSVLDKDGLFIIQQNYLPSMIANNAFDNIVHEHLEYYSLKSMQNLLSRHNMEIFDADINSLNGGSLRTYIRKVGSNLAREGSEGRIDQIKALEEGLDLTNPQLYKDFVRRTAENGVKVKDHVQNLVDEGKKVYVYGASTRGNTLLQVYGLNSELISGAAERNKDKWGKFIVGSGIPIVSEEEARNEADAFLVLPWFFKKEFTEREEEFLNQGKELIFPLPEIEVVRK